MAERREELRAADSDRQFVAERLQAALNEGRLTLSEYDERLEQTYAARTYGELDRLLDDLPATITGRDSVIPAQPTAPASPAPTTAQPEASTGPRAQHWLWAIWGSWLTTSVICTVIYLLSGSGGDFWPKWVIVPWGALSLLSTIGAVASGDPQRHVSGRVLDRRDRRQLRREGRRNLRGF